MSHLSVSMLILSAGMAMTVREAHLLGQAIVVSSSIPLTRDEWYQKFLSD